MKISVLILTSIFILGCHSVPKVKINQAKLDFTYEVENDTLSIFLPNPLKCPLHTIARSKNEVVKKILQEKFPVLLAPESDTILFHPLSMSKEDLKISFTATLGNPKAEVRSQKISLPFQRGKTYKIIQGYNGTHSHQSDYSRYAVDFDLKTGDTICAAAAGFVVGVIEEYKYGGKSKKWKDYANFVTVFHPEANIFTQYVHLTYQGSLVDVGDEVKSGEAIAISGMTGFTNGEHLHFNVLEPTEDGLVSLKVEFIEGYQGEELTKGKSVNK